MDSITEIERKLRYDVQVSNLKQLKRNERQGFITLLLLIAGGVLTLAGVVTVTFNSSLVMNIILVSLVTSVSLATVVGWYKTRLQRLKQLDRELEYMRYKINWERRGFLIDRGIKVPADGSLYAGLGWDDPEEGPPMTDCLFGVTTVVMLDETIMQLSLSWNHKTGYVLHDKDGMVIEPVYSEGKHQPVQCTHEGGVVPEVTECLDCGAELELSYDERLIAADGVKYLVVPHPGWEEAEVYNTSITPVLGTLMRRRREVEPGPWEPVPEALDISQPTNREVATDV